MIERDFQDTMEHIIEAMREKGYDPYVQLKGYVLENELGYITRHKDARRLIQALDRAQVKQYISEMMK